MSKLGPYLLEILALRRRGIGYREIARVLRDKGILPLDHSEVRRFLLRERKKAVALNRELGPFERLASMKAAQADALINRSQKIPSNEAAKSTGKRIFTPPAVLDITQ